MNLRQVEAGQHQKPLIFALNPHPLLAMLMNTLDLEEGILQRRSFPDRESYLRIEREVTARQCMVLADLSNPDKHFLPLIFLLATLRELGASQIGLVAPYLSYMRQDQRFMAGEAITSKIFAAELSVRIDWLVTVDPHLHRYHSLDQVYTVPSCAVQGAPALAAWLEPLENVFLVGPDAESEQWVAAISRECGHPYVVGAKQRTGDREVIVSLPDLSRFSASPSANYTAIIIDDVISSGQTILKCIETLKAHGITRISCAAVHGIFADQSDEALTNAGLTSLITTNTIPHTSNAIDISALLTQPIRGFLDGEDTQQNSRPIS